MYLQEDHSLLSRLLGNHDEGKNHRLHRLRLDKVYVCNGVK